MDGAGVFDLDGADTRAAAIAADVAARYGCTVRPEVVQVVPSGASGLPVLRWDEARNELRYVLAEGQSLPRFNPHQPRKGLLETRADYKEIMARRDQVRSLHAEGKAVRAMADILQVSEGVIRHDHVQLGLVPHPALRGPYAVPAAVAQRRLQIAALAGQGKDARDIGEVLGYGTRAIKAMAEAAGIALPATVRRGSGGRTVSAETLARRAEVLPLAAAGWAVGALAQRFNCSKKAIYDDIRTDPSVRAVVAARRFKRQGHKNGGFDARPEKAQVPALVAAGKTRAEMAAMFGVNINLVARWVRQLDLADVVKPSLDMAPILARRAEVVRLFEAGDNALQMAEKLAVTAVIIKNDLEILDLSLRKRDAALAAVRNKVVHDMRRAGLRPVEISKQTGVPPSTITRILACEEEAA